MPRAIRRYTDEFKQEAVSLALKSVSISHASRELGLPVATLHTGIKERSKSLFNPKSTGSTPEQVEGSKLLEEIRRLNKELAIVKEEKEILKKAAANSTGHSNSVLKIISRRFEFQCFSGTLI